MRRGPNPIWLLTSALLACGDGPTDPPPGSGQQLQGNPTAPAAAAIPRAPYRARLDDFSVTHPELPGLPISFNTIALVLETDATVGEANGLLEELEADIVGGIPGKAGITSGILFLRLPTTTHTELIDALSRIRSNPRVRHAVQDVLLGPTIISKPHAGGPFDWQWDPAPLGENWGLEVIRAPQLWNFNGAIGRLAPDLPEVLILDDGYDAAHPDLTFLTPPSLIGSHGTHVAGVIGAGFSNGIGVDGVNPFARMLPAHGAATGALSSWGELAISRAEELIRLRPRIRVINSSLGYNWVLNFNIDAKNNPSAQENASEEGAILREMLAGLEADGLPLPVWLTAAGNDSDSPFGDQVALWASPMANAALEHGAKNIIVVEAVGTSANIASGETVRFIKSNLGGHLSAPGVDIMSTTPSPRYQLMSGTSMATPHVAGLVAYLYALDPSLPRPTLQSNPILDLLLASAVPSLGGARPRIDAFAAALEVDRIQGGTHVLRLLTDIDDGTADGNQRTADDGVADYTDDAGGDGQVDMSDFRRWRDWALQIHFPAAHVLDGSGSHAKKDLNGNGDMQQGAPEDLYPRGDFNGDGRLTIDATAHPVGGAIGQSVTDLGVLQHLFDDPDYAAGELPALIASGDLHLDATDCLSASGGVTARTSVSTQGTPSQPSRIHDAAHPVQIHTVAAAPSGTAYVLTMEALNADGATIASVEDEATLLLGMDLRWHPTCESGPVATLEGLPGAGSVANVSFQNANSPPSCAKSDQSHDAVDPLPGLTLSATCPPTGAVSNEGTAMSGRASTAVTYAFDLQGNELRSYTATAQVSAAAQGEGEVPGKFPSEAGKAFSSASSNASFEFEITAPEAEITLSGQLTSEIATDDQITSASASVRIGPYFAMAGRIGNSGPILPDVAIGSTLRLPRGIYSLEITAHAGVGTYTLQPSSEGKAGFTVTLTVAP